MKHYLIDSENVGDFWIPLLELPAEQAELIVFYTKNSPHMSYDSLIKLKESDRTVTFIKCYEGTNALDFQLCSELGFLIANDPGDEFIIVTNDTGYDAAVKYWRRKEYSVKRIAGKDSRTGGRRRGTPARFDVAAEVSAILHKLVKLPDHDESEAEQAAEEEREQISPETSGYGKEQTKDFEDQYDAEPEEEEAYSEEDGVVKDEMEEEAEEESEFESGYDAEDGSDEEADEEDEDDEDEDADEEDADEEEIDEEDADEEESGDREEEYSEDPSDGSSSGGFSSEDFSSDGYSTDVISSDENEAAEGEGKEDPALNPVISEAEESSADADAGEQDPQEIPSAHMDEEAPEAEEESAAFIPDPEEITAIVNCIGMDNLAELHNQLIQFYGDDGKEIYQALKSGALSIDKKDWDREEKFLYYCALIFRHSDEPAEALTEETISEFASFVLGAENKRKNLNSLRYALLKHYGKEKGRRYYFMVKPYVKALNQM